MDVYSIAKVPFRLLLYGFVLIYLAADWGLRGPVYERMQRFRPGSERSQAYGVEQGWAATVNGKPITVAQLELSLDLFLARRGQRREDLTATNLRIAKLAVLDGMISDKLIEIWSDARPLEVPESYLEERVRQFKARFLPGELKTLCGEQDLSLDELSRMVRRHASQQYWLETLVAGAAEVLPEELDAWWERNGGKVERPEIFRARHLFLSTVEKPSAEQEALIRGLSRRLDEGESFEALVEAHSEDLRTRAIGGELGWFSRERMPERFMAEVTGLNPGERSAPFETSIGWHVVELLDRKAAESVAREDLEPEVAAYLESLWRDAALRKLLGEQLRVSRRARVEVFPTVNAE